MMVYILGSETNNSVSVKQLDPDEESPVLNNSGGKITVINIFSSIRLG
jgi:hypothetical protein